MRITSLFLFFSALFFLLHDFSIGIAANDSPPVIINRSLEVHEIDGKKYHFHAVLQGQTLFSIARAYSVSIEDIIAENPELEHGLRYDQLIRIPYVEKPVKIVTKTEYLEHKVKRRETLYGISNNYGISPNVILEHNPDARKGLKVDQIILIPKEIRKEEPLYKEYLVVSGDTYYSLSRRFNTSINEIKELNPELNDILKAGHTIKLPYHSFLKPEEKIIELIKPTDTIDYEKELWDVQYCNDPKLKDKYNIALLIPLFIEDLEEYYQDGELLQSNHKSFTFLEYYEGMLIALDSAKRMGANIELFVYDVCQDVTKAWRVVNSPEFKEMDLIIGSFFPNSLEIIARHAKREDIAVVSPLLQNREQLSLYSNLFQFTPSLLTQLNDLAEYVSYKYPTQNIILVHDNQPHVSQIIREFNHNLNNRISKKRYVNDSINLARVNGYYYNHTLVGERSTNVYVFNDSLLENFQPPSVRQTDDRRNEIFNNYKQHNHIKEIVLYRDSMQGLANTMSEITTNVLVSLLGGEPVVTNYLRELSLMADTFDLKVFGVPQWRNYRNIEIDHLHAADVHIISSDFIDYSDKNIQNFVIKFRERFYNEPNLYAFKGFETGFYFMNALMTFGKDFHKCIYQLNEIGGHNSIRFEKPVGKENGWENTRATIYGYDNYRIIDVRKSSFAGR